MNELRKKEAIAGIIGAVAGVISTLIAGFTLYNQHTSGSFDDFAKMVMLGEALKQNDPVLEIPHAPPSQQKEVYKNFTLNNNGCLIREAFQKAVNIATEMNSSSTRNENINKLIKHALCRDDTRDAAWAADKITSSYTRDDSYEEIVLYLLNHGNIEEARRLSDKIESSYSRDELKSKIIQRLSR